MDEATEREHIRLCVEVQHKVIGTRPLGIYQGKPNANTLKLVAEEGGFLYNSDTYADDLPWWNLAYGKPLLMIPYTLDNNDMRFAQALEGDRFFAYLKDSFDVLWEEGATAPKMMSIGLHCRIVGRPGRALGLAKFLDYVKVSAHSLCVSAVLRCVRGAAKGWVCFLRACAGARGVVGAWCRPRKRRGFAGGSTSATTGTSTTSPALPSSRGEWSPWHVSDPSRPLAHLAASGTSWCSQRAREHFSI